MNISRCLTSLSGYLAAVICCAALTSCSDVEPLELTDATLEGTVTYKGKPVPAALVIVTGDRGSSTGRAATDGTFRVDQGLPVYKTGALTTELRGRKEIFRPRIRSRWVVRGVGMWLRLE